MSIVNRDGALYMATGIDNTGLRKGVSEAESIIEQLRGAAQKAGLAIGGMFAVQGMRDFVSQVVEIRGEFQKLETSYNVLLGNKAQADRLMNEMVSLAATTPFALRDVSSGSKQLLAYGIAAEDITEDLRRLGDVAAGLGLPLQRLTYLYGTTLTQGRLYARDMLQFTTSGIPLLQELADKYGTSTQEINEMVTAGKIGFAEVKQAIYNMTGEGGKFANMMDALSKTIPGRIEKLKDAVDVLLNNIGKANEGVINKAIDAAAYLVENYQEIGHQIMELVAAYGAYKAVLMSITAYRGAMANVTYTAEIAELQKLTAVKKLSMDADSAQAVSSGRVTEAKAAEVQALRAEIAAELDSLKTAEAAAAARLTAANQEYQAALKRSVLAKKALADRQAEAQAIMLSGTAEEKAVARKSVLAAKEKLHNAAIAKGTALRNQRTAATAKTAATEAVESAALAANTATQNANSKSTAILTAAKVKLAAASRALGLSMLANPYVLAAAAVAGLSYGIYKLVTYETEAEKATKKLNESLKEAQAKLHSEQTELDYLFEKLKSATEGSEEYRGTMNKINSLYSEYLPKQLTEKKNLDDIADAYREVCEQMQKKIMLEARDAAIKKSSEEEAEKQVKAVDNIRKTIQNTYKKSTSESLDIVQEMRDKVKLWQSTGTSENDIILGLYRDFGNKFQKSSKYFGKDIKDFVRSAVREANTRKEAEDLYAPFIEAKKKAANELDEVVITYDSKSKQGETSKENKKKKKELEKRRKKEAADAKSIEDDLFRIRQENAAKRIELSEGSFTKEMAVLREQYRAKKELLEKEEKELLEKATTQKQVADINSTYNVKVELLTEEFEKQKNEILDTLNLETNEYEAKRVEVKRKYAEERKKIEADIKASEAEGDKEAVKRLQDYLENIDVKERREKIKIDFEEFQGTEEYTRAFEDLRKVSDDTLNYLIKKMDTFKVEATKTLQPTEVREYIKTLEELMEERDVRMNVFDRLKEKSEKLTDAIKAAQQAQRELAEATMQKDAGEDAQKRYIDALANYRKKQDEARRAQTEMTDAEREALEVVRELSESINGLGSAIGGTAGDIVGLLGDVMNFGIKTMEAVQKASEVTAAAISKLEKASVILTIVSAAIQLVNKVGNILPNSTSQYSKYASKIQKINDIKTAVNDYRLAVLEAQKAENEWFSTKGMQSLVDKATVAKEAIKSYYDKANELQATYQNAGPSGVLGGINNIYHWTVEKPMELVHKAIGTIGGEWVKKAGEIISKVATEIGGASMIVPALFESEEYKKGLTKAIDNMRVITRHKTWFRGEKSENLVDYLQGNYGMNLFDDKGMIDLTVYEELQKKIDDGTIRMDELGKDTLDELAKYAQTYKDYQDELKEYVSNLYEPLYEDMTSAIWDWYNDGKDALDSFREYATDTFRDIATDMMNTILSKQVFDGAKEELLSIYDKYAKGDMSIDSLRAQTTDKMAEIQRKYQETIPALQEFLTAYGNGIEGLGISLKEASAETSEVSDNTLKGAYSKASQESIDLLAGQTGAVRVLLEDIRRIMQESGSEALKEYYSVAQNNLAVLVQIQTDGWREVSVVRELVQQVAQNTAQLNDINRDIAAANRAIQERVSSVSSNVNDIAVKGVLLKGGGLGM